MGRNEKGTLVEQADSVKVRIGSREVGRRGFEWVDGVERNERNRFFQRCDGYRFREQWHANRNLDQTLSPPKKRLSRQVPQVHVHTDGRFNETFKGTGYPG